MLPALQDQAVHKVAQGHVDPSDHKVDVENLGLRDPLFQVHSVLQGHRDLLGIRDMSDQWETAVQQVISFHLMRIVKVNKKLIRR